MKTKSIAKRVSAIVLILLLTLAVMAPMYVGAAGGGAPTNPYWDGHSAVWSAPTNHTPDSYTVRYYKDSVFTGTMTCFGTSLDMDSIMKEKGNGNYSFEVTANYTDGSYSTSIRSGSIAFYDTSKGHEHPLAHIDFKYPTCTEKGRKEHYECGDCGRYFWDEDGQNEITDKSEVVLPATGHDWGEWQIVKEATTDAEGEQKRVCNNDYNHVETKSIPKLSSGDQQSKTEAATEAKTETTKAAETTAPATTGKKEPGDPSLKGSSKLVSEDSEDTVFGIPTGWFVVIIIAAVLVIVVPGVIALILLANRRKNDDDTKKKNK